jgi:hypothetical protein
MNFFVRKGEEYFHEVNIFMRIVTLMTIYFTITPISIIVKSAAHENYTLAYFFTNNLPARVTKQKGKLGRAKSPDKD